jgi:hypothetical protein
VKLEGDPGKARDLGEQLAKLALDEGASLLLAGITA